MARIYATKGDAAKRARITIPVTVQMIGDLFAVADRMGVSPTVAARSFLERGIKGEKSNADLHEGRQAGRR